MNFQQLIEDRHSCRRFRNTPIEPEKMDYIYNAIRLAPTAGNLQAYAVRVATTKEQKLVLTMGAYGQVFVNEAPVSLVFFAVPELSAVKYEDRGSNLYCIQDATIACTYAHLAAQDVGLASCWVGAFNDRIVSQCMKAEWTWKPVAILPIGYSEQKMLTGPPKSDRVQTYDSSSDYWRSR